MSPDGIIDWFIPDVMAKDHKNILHTFDLVENSQLLILNWWHPIRAKFTKISGVEKWYDEYAYTCRFDSFSISISIKPCLVTKWTAVDSPVCYAPTIGSMIFIISKVNMGAFKAQNQKKKKWNKWWFGNRWSRTVWRWWKIRVKGRVGLSRKTPVGDEDKTY